MSKMRIKILILLNDQLNNVTGILKFYKFVKNVSMAKVYEIVYTVKTTDIDELNHVNNAVYVQWMDDLAHKHWEQLTENYPLPEYIWVVLRHEVDYKSQAVLNDLVTMKTWIGTTGGFKSERHFEFYKNDILLVKSKTTYAMLDAKTYKPSRIRENVLKVLEPFK